MSNRLAFLLISPIALLPVAAAPAADSLAGIVAPGARAEVLGAGYGFCEGPAADAEGNVYFSDGKNDTIHLWRPGRPVEVFVDDSLDANGMMFNARGELVVCEGAAFRIVAFDVKTKAKRILAGQGDRQYNEPNDLAIDSAGGFYFTDPNYRHRGQEAIKKELAYYCSPEGKVAVVSDVCTNPNGVLLSADEKTLYLADCRGKLVYRYGVASPGKLTGETRWLDLGASPDGMTADAEGNLYIACGAAGVKVYSREGEPIGQISAERGVPYASNVCFGGKDFRTLLVTSKDRFLGVQMKVAGARPLPGKK